MPSKTEAIRNFLRVKARPDLADLYGPHMEVQVNVSAGDGDRVEGEYEGHRWSGWTDGLQTWKSYRIPFNAKANPEYRDSEIKFDLAAHAEGIGMTGWDWVNKRSRYVAYDFDAIAGHSEAHTAKLTDEELNEVRKAACAIPWVTVRQSTSGNGLHLYVFLDGVETHNHVEHAAVARAILGKMSAIAGCDFDAKVDNCGGNIWIWHEKFDRVGGMNGPGLKLIKKGEILHDIPANWRDHIKVTSGKRRKSLPGFIDEKEETDDFVELCGQRPKVVLDEDHKRLITWLEENGHKESWWDADNHMLVCHTIDLQDAHARLGLRGIFKTKSSGSSGQNCFCFPMRKGAWSVRRHTAGVQEDESWDQDGSGWTRCYLNREPDVATAAKIFGGNKDDKGTYVFRETETAIEAAKALGAHVNLPNFMMGRQAKLRVSKDQELVFELARSETDSVEKMQGWIEKRGGLWQKLFKIKNPQHENEVGNYEDVVRHLISESGKDAGWVVKSDGKWIEERLEHIKHVLTALGLAKNDISSVLGNGVMKKWTLVNKPFEPEYPGDRLWNRDGAQFAFAPSIDEHLNYPDWTAVLNHTGSGLDSAIKNDVWCKANGIQCGGDYLKLWVAHMFQKPFEPLPYLFFYGQEKCGKSIFFESLKLLVTKGVGEANESLLNPNNFNGELEGLIFCGVEEIDLRGNKSSALTRLKKWVTGKTMNIHRKNCTPYDVPNCSHWVHTANNPEFCPIFEGDTRIVASYVSPLPDDQRIGTYELLTRLKKQAPDFLAAVLNLELPTPYDRLNIPVIITEEKKSIQKGNRSLLEEFLSEVTHPIDGHMIKLGDLFERFQEWLPPSMLNDWTVIRFGREIVKLGYVKGRSMRHGAQFFIGNIAFEELPPMTRLVLEGEKLVNGNTD